MFQKLSTILGVLRELRDLRRHENWTPAELHAHQQAALTSLRGFAYAHSPFYQSFHRGYEQAPLSELPILTKAQLMEHFDELITDRRVQLDAVRAHLAAGRQEPFLGSYEVVTTSGSTGHPGIFLLKPQEWVTIMASFARAREWARVKLDLTRRSRMAVVSSTNERNVSARVGKAADTPFIPTLRLDAMQPLPEILGALNDWQPEVLVAYASMANFLAAEQVMGRLAIHPRAVFVSSEVLTPQMRARVEQAWGNVVFNEYAATETATIAAEDTDHHGMHLFEDLLIVENVDALNHPVPPGTFGDKLLVTVLFSRTQPLIRYEISDRVRLAVQPPSCHLPFRVVDGVQGRAEDILVLHGREDERVQVHPNVFHDVMDAIPNNGWQIVQTEDGLRLRVVPTAAPLDQGEVEARIKAALSRQGVAEIRVQVQPLDEIPKAPSGKTPLIKGL